jgi:indolepyruvate ferredoxin oxidoreductase
MAPPFLLTRKDSRDRPGKREFGGWLSKPLSALAGMKKLRGTPFDVFGYTGERRLERSLIPWYTDLMEQCADNVTAGNIQRWQAIMDGPIGIRGSGAVKEQSIDKVKAEIDELLEVL